MGDFLEQKLRAKVFSIRYTVINLGVAIGPLFGVFIELSSSGIGFIITGISYLVYSVSLHIVFNKVVYVPTNKMNSVPTIRESLSIIKKDKVLLYFIVGACITQIGFAQFAPLSQHLSLTFEKGVLYFGWLMTINASVVVVEQLPVTLLFARFSTITGVYVGNVLYAIGEIGFVFSNENYR